MAVNEVVGATLGPDRYGELRVVGGQHDGLAGQQPFGRATRAG